MERKIYSKIHREKTAADKHEKKIKDLGGEIIRRIDRPNQIYIQYKFKIKKYEARLLSRNN
jgi:hypothetical protein